MRNYPKLFYNLASGIRRLHWSSDELRKYQEKRLRNVVKHAYDTCPFYRQKLKKAGVFPGDIRSIHDTKRLPITKKDEFRNEKPERLLSSDFTGKSLVVKTTSGSTGKPLRVYLTSGEDDWRKAIYLRANVACGQRFRDKWAVITSPRHFGNTTKIQQILKVYAQTCISVFSDVNQQIATVKNLKPDILDGYSGALYLLARKIDELGIDLDKPRLIFGSADVADLTTRKYIENVFGAPYHDQFGCIEIDRAAWQCPERVAYHMDVDSVITEFVDEDGQEVSCGETGEILFTSLFNQAMPFIRYAVGDMGKPSDDSCSCGITLPLMEIVEGRKDSFILLPNGQLESPRTFTIALSMSSQYENIEQFRILQKKSDLLEFLIKKKNQKIPDEVMEEKLTFDLRNLLEIAKNMRFEIRFVEEIPTSKSGKLTAVFSEVRSPMHS